jgi:SulP family sulfate permease
VTDRGKIASVLAGATTGLLTIVFSLSFAALIFDGPLAPWASHGFRMALLSAVAIGTTVALGSSLPAVIAIPQDRTAPIFAVMAGGIAAALGDRPDVAFLTTVTAMMVGTVGTGALLGTLGLVRAGNLVRFVPMPVIGGFLAGSGWLLVTGAVRVMTGEPGGWSDVPELFRTPKILDWAPGALYGLTVFLVLRKSRKPLVLPFALILGVALFYLAVTVAGGSLEDVRARGWLPRSLDAEGGLSPIVFTAPIRADWGVIASVAGNLVTIMVVSLVSVLLNATAIELASGRDLDLDRELRSVGAANLIAGLGGGLVGFHSLSLTGIAIRMGADSRVAGLSMAALAGAALLLGVPFLDHFPIPVIGALLFLLGISFLVDWLWDGWSRLPLTDWLIVALIVGVVGTAGYMEGVLVGIGAAVVFFVVRYSRVNVVRHALSGATHRSNVDRPSGDRRILDEAGDRLHILELQGFLFFGTANLLLERLRKRLVDPDDRPLRHIVLDMHRVTGLDSSAATSLGRIRDLCVASGVTFVLVHPPAGSSRQLLAAGLRPDGQALVEFRDLDLALEWCEDRLLEELRGPAGEPQVDIDALFATEGADGEFAAIARRYFERREVSSGTEILRQGERSEGLFFVERGSVSVWLELEGGRRIRLRTMRAGTVIGELGLYLGQPRNATVVADSDCVVQHLGRGSLDRLLDERPEVAARFHFFMVRMLAERLVMANGAIRALTR